MDETEEIIGEKEEEAFSTIERKIEDEHKMEKLLGAIESEIRYESRITARNVRKEVRDKIDGSIGKELEEEVERSVEEAIMAAVEKVRKEFVEGQENV